MFKKSILSAAALMLAAAGAQAAVGDSVTYSFNAQSQGNAVPTFEQASLTITETLLGVDLILTPNWAGGGNRVDQLVFVYSGDAFTFVDGAGPTPTVVLKSNTQIDSGYVASPFVIDASWPSNGANNFDPADASTTWSMNGADVTLDDFLLSAVTNLQKPSPSFGVISMPGANTPGASGSNWVAGSPVAPIPEPSTYALMAAGLGLVGFVARRRKPKV
jgi:hypothetical protein